MCEVSVSCLRHVDAQSLAKIGGSRKIGKVNALAVHEIFVVVDDGLSLRMRRQLEDASGIPLNPVPRSGLQLENTFFTGKWRRADAMSVFCLNTKHEQRSALKNRRGIHGACGQSIVFPLSCSFIECRNCCRPRAVIRAHSYTVSIFLNLQSSQMHGHFGEDRAFSS